jgi:hypothetical protein
MKLGKLPAIHDPRTLSYRNYKTGSAVIPVEAHWGHGLVYGSLGNTMVGDCVEAAYAHQVQVWDARAGHPWAPTTPVTLAAYSAITGYTPSVPSSDNGTNMLSALNYWRATGLDGHKLTAFARINPRVMSDVKESVAWFGGVNLGLQLPLNCQGTEQWVVRPGPGSAAGSWGGHCVPIVGYGPSWAWVNTWGNLTAVSWDFLATYSDEAYVLLSEEWMEASGTSPAHLAWGQLQADLANL